MDVDKYPRLAAFMKTHPELTRDQVHEYIEAACKKKGLL